MVDKFTDMQIDELRDCFNRLLDRDGDGRLSKEDLQGGLKVIGIAPTDKELDDMIYELNTSRLGAIDFSEFLNGMSRTTDFVDDDLEIQEAFNVYDVKNQGFITKEDLEVTLKKIGEKLEEGELDELMKEADVDGDGKISLPEFKRIVNKK